MRLLIIQPHPYPYYGVMSIAGYLQRLGVQTEVLITSLESINADRFPAGAPALIGFSVLSNDLSWLDRSLAQVRALWPATPVIVGGIHALLFGRDLLADPRIDYVCCGDGEPVLAALSEALRRGADPPAIPGLLTRAAAAGNDPPLLFNVAATEENREIYYARYPQLAAEEQKQFLTMRACPYDCAFCYGAQLRRVLGTETMLVRRKPPAVVIAEIRRVRERWGMRCVFFSDDLFTHDVLWLREFLPRYRDEIGLPFIVSLRLDQLDPETAAALRAAGCYLIRCGVETGNEPLRRQVLKKNMSNAALTRGVHVARAAGLKIQTSNMFCLPGETPALAWETVEFNCRLGTDYIFATVFLPFPGTQLTGQAIRLGLLPANYSYHDLPRSFFRPRSVLALPARQEVENIMCVAALAIRWPRLIPLLRRLTRIPGLQWLHRAVYYGSLFVSYRHERRLSWREAGRLFFRFRHMQ